MNKDDFIVIRSQGKQMIISEKSKVNFDLIKDQKKFAYEVLLQSKGGKLSIGTPTLPKVKVNFNFSDQVVKGKKVKVFKYKSKSRYRKRMGIRPKFTSAEVAKIE